MSKATNAERAAQAGASNKAKHVVSLTLSKTADALIEPKLMLTWLLTALGAPAYLLGAVVPIREAGALLPQPLIARWAGRYATRKRFWSLGAMVQGLAAVCIAGAAFAFEGAVAGWVILLALTVLACARAIASTTYKDALARTVDKDARGTVTGTAGTIAAAIGLAFGAALAAGLFGTVSVAVVAGAVLIGGLLFAAAALVFVQLDEPPQDAQDDEGAPLRGWLDPLREDANFRRFVAVRAALTVTALAPPYLLLATASDGQSALTTLGPMVVASGLAATLSSALWGRLSDRSSRMSLLAGGGIAALAYAAAALAVLSQGAPLATWLAAGLLFVAQIGYQGVRSGRSIYLTNMASDDVRLRYTALSNILIGGVLLLGFALGPVAHVFGVPLVLGICAGIAALGGLAGLRLNRV